MSDNSFYACGTCRQRVEPDAPDTVAAYEQILSRTLAGDSYIDGPGFYFHGGCYPTGDPRYRRAD